MFFLTREDESEHERHRRQLHAADDCEEEACLGLENHPEVLDQFKNKKNLPAPVTKHAPQVRLELVVLENPTQFCFLESEKPEKEENPHPLVHLPHFPRVVKVGHSHVADDHHRQRRLRHLDRL